MNSLEIKNYISYYDSCPVIPKHLDLKGISWDTCFASPLPRALVTAETVFPGPIIIEPDLREIDLVPDRETGMRLPFFLWAMYGRLSWLKYLNPISESRESVMTRVDAVLSKILSDPSKNVLIVSHGGIMYFIKKWLFSKGFKGPEFLEAANAKLYLYSSGQS